MAPRYMVIFTRIHSSWKCSENNLVLVEEVLDVVVLLDVVIHDFSNKVQKIIDVCSIVGEDFFLDVVNKLVDVVDDELDGLMSMMVSTVHVWALGHLVEDGNWDLNKVVDGMVQVFWHVLVKTVVLEGNGDEFDHD
jgi:hypothetical protein